MGKDFKQEEISYFLLLLRCPHWKIFFLKFSKSFSDPSADYLIVWGIHGCRYGIIAMVLFADGYNTLYEEGFTLKENRKAVLRLGTAFLVLCAVSLYRQICRNFYPSDRMYTGIVFAVYLLLIIFWLYRILSRVTQKTMRIFLCAEISVMVFWLTIRFIQESFLYRNISLMRASGYLISVPAVAIPLLGLYAAFGLGKGESYRFQKKWHFTLIPAAALILLAVTNEYHHFMFSAPAGEPRPNLYFHPYIGMYLIFAWAGIFVIARIVVIYRRNRVMQEKSSFYKLLPFCEVILLPLFCIPYALSAFFVTKELIEFSAGVMFIEAVEWEACIFVGLVPVNTQYDMVFDRSTIAMQIVKEDGSMFLKSKRAPVLSERLFSQLQSDGVAFAGSTLELHSYKIHGGYLIWQKDVSKIRPLIAELKKTAGELEQESTLLGEELRTKSEEAKIQAQNHIYDILTEEVGGQLSLLKELLKKRETAEDKNLLFREICLIGTYIKRRCNLRLLEQESGHIEEVDLELAFRDMISSMNQFGIHASMEWKHDTAYSAEFSLFLFDVLEFLIESLRFSPVSVRIAAENLSSFSISVQSDGVRPCEAPREETARINKKGYGTFWQVIPAGYRLVLCEEAE